MSRLTEWQRECGTVRITPQTMPQLVHGGEPPATFRALVMDNSHVPARVQSFTIVARDLESALRRLQRALGEEWQARSIVKVVRP